MPVWCITCGGFCSSAKPFKTGFKIVDGQQFNAGVCKGK